MLAFCGWILIIFDIIEKGKNVLIHFGSVDTVNTRTGEHRFGETAFLQANHSFMRNRVGFVFELRIVFLLVLKLTMCEIRA